MDTFDELWHAMENVNPTYQSEEWPKCPDCGRNTDMTFWGIEDKGWIPVPRLIFCSCGWARVEKTRDD